MCKKCQDDSPEVKSAGVILEDLKHEEKSVEYSITQIRTRAAHIMLVTSISLGIFAGLFEYAGKDAKIFSEHIVVFVILIIIPISFFFKSLYNSFQVIKARTPLTESTAKNYCKLENNLSCLLDSYNKLIKYHKTFNN